MSPHHSWCIHGLRRVLILPASYSLAMDSSTGDVNVVNLDTRPLLGLIYFYIYFRPVFVQRVRTNRGDRKRELSGTLGGAPYCSRAAIAHGIVCARFRLPSSIQE